MKKLSIILSTLFFLTSMVTIFSGCDKNLRYLLTGKTDREDQIKELSNPSLDNIKKAVIRVVNWMAAGASGIAAIFFIHGGLQYMLAFGSEEKVEKAKNTLFFALVGMIIVILAYTAVLFLIGFFASDDALRNIMKKP